jgi:hypothetical protein
VAQNVFGSNKAEVVVMSGAHIFIAKGDRPRPLLDPLAIRLMRHHRHLGDPKILNRLLPVARPTAPPIPEILKEIIVGTLDKVAGDAPTPYAGPLGPLRRILAEVCDKHGMPLMDIKGKARTNSFVQVRNEYFYRAASELTVSYKAIGRVCGGRDHSTVMFGVNSYCAKHDLPHPRRNADYDTSGVVERKRARERAARAAEKAEARA